MELNTAPIRVSPVFSFSVARKTIVVEHSDLGRRSILNPLYDDACDVGVVLYNPDTNRTTRWFMHEELRDADRDLQATIYKPTHESVRKFPQLAGWEMHILND